MTKKSCFQLLLAASILLLTAWLTELPAARAASICGTTTFIYYSTGGYCAIPCPPHGEYCFGNTSGKITKEVIGFCGICE